MRGPEGERTGGKRVAVHGSRGSLDRTKLQRYRPSWQKVRTQWLRSASISACARYSLRRAQRERAMGVCSV